MADRAEGGKTSSATALDESAKLTYILDCNLTQLAVQRPQATQRLMRRGVQAPICMARAVLFACAAPSREGNASSGKKRASIRSA